MSTLKYATNERIYETYLRNRLTDTENRLWLPRQGWGGEGRIGSLGLAETNYYILDG